MVKMTLGESLTLFRRRRGLSQDELGTKAGLSGNTVGRIESGENSPRIDQLEALAHALGLEFIFSLEPKIHLEFAADRMSPPDPESAE